ncbi:hypothetical protein PLESTB_000517600 [Pleodorina starrii]|uniref:Syntaxin 18 n=1 Tax=Pleodorina starrii TaxID=330485 RepID=A0A9W6BGF3_9CHLO|nr:hypothetical protein PLESTB_000517600 [Pleodorina starrii]
MDRTKDLIAAAERFLDTASLPPEQTRRLREAVLLGRRSRAPGSFAVAAKGVEDSVVTLWGSIRSMQQEYAREAGALAVGDPAKDANEAQVAAFIGRIGGYIDRLKEAATAAQKSAERVNEQTSAHMHGVVLILAERLHRATMSFDRLRAARYQALVDQRAPGLAAAAAVGSSTSAAGGRAGRQAGAQAAAAESGRPGAAVTTARSGGWQHILGLHLSGPKGHEHDDEDGPLGSPSARDAAAAAKRGTDWPVQLQDMEQENKALLERLTATRGSALSVEQAVRDVAALNQMFSSAVLAQAETIEAIYLAAVDATHNITAGNEALTKTVAVNRSTTRYIVVLLLVATLCLLFFDWFNS